MIALALSARPAEAQQVSFGIKGGVNSATIVGSDVDQAEATARGVGGVFMLIQLSKIFAIMPEVLYSQKGTRNNWGDFTGIMKVDYLEVPQLIRFSAPIRSNRWVPYAVIGHTFAFKMRCDVDGDRCDDVAVGLPVKSFDYGVVAGLGADITLGRAAILIDGRYTYGLPHMDDFGGNVHNSVGAIMVGIRMPVGRILLTSRTPHWTQVR